LSIQYAVGCVRGSSIGSGIGRPHTLRTALVLGSTDTDVGGCASRDVKEPVICEYEIL